MKTTLKVIGIIFLVLMGIGSISKTLINPAEETAFKAQIKRANSECPIPVANGIGQVSSITLENNALVYRLDYLPEYLNVEAYKRNPEATRDMFYLVFVCLSAQGSQFKMLIDELGRKGYGMKIIASNGSEDFTSELTNDYICEMNQKMSMNPSEALHNALLLKLETERCSCPINIADGMILENIELDGTDIVMNVTVDEDLYDIDAFKIMEEDFGQNLINQANNGDPEVGALLDLCKASHSGLIYRIKGNLSHKICDMKVPSTLIRQRRVVPHQINLN